MDKVLAVSILSLLSGCTWFQRVDTSLSRGIPCNVLSEDGKHGFEPDKGAADRWTDGELRQLVIINENGVEFCSWEPPNK